MINKDNMLENLFCEFISLVEEGDIDIYNEFSFQHELGIFIRNKFKDYKVQFERNINFFGIVGTIKKEIDIVIYNDYEKYAIELKYPRNGQYPEQMFCFINDICFMEQLKSQGFKNTYCITVVNDKNFLCGDKKDGIYSYFRNNKIINGYIKKPTGKKDKIINIKNHYKIKWKNIDKKYKYYFLEI